MRNEQSSLLPTSPGPHRFHESLEHKLFSIEHNHDNLLFIPCYCALLVKKVSNLNLTEGIVKISCSLIIRINTRNVNPLVLAAIKESLEFRLCEEVISLQVGKTEGLTFSRKDDLFVFTYRFVRDIPFDVQLKNTPFDEFDIPIEIELTSTYVKVQENQTIKYRFNVHDHKEPTISFSFKDKADGLPQFDILHEKCATQLIAEHKKDSNRIIYSYYPKSFSG